jgi:uncharacterized protein (TIGR02588 family)
MTQAQQQRQDDGRRSRAEWTTLVTMFVIVGALVGILVWRALTGGDEAAFDVRVDEATIVQRGETYQVPFTVQNTGPATAEDVLVRVALMQGDQTVEETELTFRFMAGGESAEGIALFAHDPRSYTLDTQVTSFLVP